MAGSTTILSLIKPEATDTSKIREDFNTNMDTIDGRFSAIYMAVQAKASVTITGGSITGITDLVVADGGTGVSTLTDGGILLGSGTGAITAMAVLTDGQMIVGNGTTDPVAESGATLRTSIGVAIGTNVQAYDAGLTAIAALAMTDSSMLVGNGTTWVLETGDTLRASLGLTIGTHVQAWDTQLDDIAALAVTNGNFIVGDGTNWVAESGATARTSLGLAIGTNVQAYDDALTNISALTYVSPSFIKLTADDTYAVRTLDETKEDLDVDDLENLTNYLDSPCIVTGGEITEGTTGTFTVAAITAALLRSSASATAALMPVTLAIQSNQVIDAADTTYFIIFTYGDPCTIDLSTDAPNGYNIISLGKVMKDSSDNVHYISGGYRLSDGVAKLHHRAGSLRGKELTHGSAIAYLATDKFTMETGTAFVGINEISFGAYNSNTTTFTPVYQAVAGWDEDDTPRNTIDVAYYDDGTGTLHAITAQQYGCHWVYRHIDDGHVYVVYGRGSYKLAEAVAANEPTHPTHLTDFGCLIGCIIAPQAGGSFTIQMVTDQFFTGTAVSDHANLSHLAYADAGHTGFQSTLTNEAGLYAALSDVTGFMQDGESYTNLTSFVDQTAWRVFYSNTDGDVTELALGDDGTYLKSNGAAAAPTFGTPEGAGDVTKVGTPADSQVGVWTGDGTIEGDASLTYDRSNLQLTGDIGSTGTRITKGWFANLETTGDLTVNGTALASTYMPIFTGTDTHVTFFDGANSPAGEAGFTYIKGTDTLNVVNIACTSITGALTGNADTVTTNANLTGIVTSTGNATVIADKAIAIAKLADGTDGQLITWSADGVIAAVATGDDTQVLTSNGAGTAPTFQDASGGAGETNTASNIGSEVEIYKQKTGVDLEFRTLKTDSTKLTITTTDPTEKKEYQDTANAYYFMNDAADDRVGQQWLTTSAYMIGWIKVRMYRTGNPGNVVLNLYLADGDNKPTGNSLTTATINGNNITTSDSGGGELVTFDVTNYSVDDATRYALVMSCPTSDGSNNIKYFRGSDDMGNANGLYSSNAGASWTVTPNDLLFEIWSTSASYNYVLFDVVESEIRLDDLGTPDDNTDLNASTAAHGLMPKLPNVATQFLDGAGVWAILATGDIPDLSATYASSGANSSITSLTGLTTPLGAAYGGTGVANNALSTLTILGNFATTLTVTEATGVTLPASGTLYGTLADSISSANLLSSLSDETGTGLLVFGTTPTLTTPVIGAATGTSLTLSGQSGCKAYRGTANQTIPTAKDARIYFNAESYDNLGEFDVTVKTGTASATTAFHLIDTTLSPFVAGDVGRFLWNTTDNTYTIVTAYNSTSDVTITHNIFASGEGYKAYFSRFTATTTGTYLIVAAISYVAFPADKKIQISIKKNNNFVAANEIESSIEDSISAFITIAVKLEIDDYIEANTAHFAGTNMDIRLGELYSFLSVTKLY